MPSSDLTTPTHPSPGVQQAPATEPSVTTARATARRRRVALWAGAGALVVAAVVGWLTYTRFHQAPAEPATGNTLAMDVSGGWWSISGDRYLQLDWDGRRATLLDYSGSDQGVRSTGTWRTSQRTVSVNVDGAAGKLSQDFELVGNDAEAFLAPAPAANAKLMDSWIADHGDDDEDAAPDGPSTVQAGWRLPRRE